MIVPALSLARREVVRFFRQRGRVIGALVTPVLFWLIMGSGIGSSFVGGGGDYLRYAFPGTTTMILLFTCIFSSISIIEDRNEGFLQSVLASPAPRASIVLGKVVGGALLGWLQAFPFLLLAPTVGIPLTVSGLAIAAVVLAASAVFLAAVGFFFAWRSSSVAGFHAIMNIVLMPMWLVSGALFPLAGAYSWMAWAMRLNPLTWGLSAVRTALTPSDPGPFPLPLSLAVVTGCAILAVLACALTIRSEK
ncbi:MAG: ABC transporter permease [Candidatus Brocadiae bacterium]|nr:ABC transporter permease [Candidatus Brocadiia bacterium]